jgi:hypothetical protein
MPANGPKGNFPGGFRAVPGGLVGWISPCLRSKKSGCKPRS